eukprot:1379102-Amorphochlora_amoeboformis.AAC.2
MAVASIVFEYNMLFVVLLLASSSALAVFGTRRGRCRIRVAPVSSPLSNEGLLHAYSSYP